MVENLPKNSDFGLGIRENNVVNRTIWNLPSWQQLQDEKLEEAHDSQEHELSLVILLWYNSASKSSNSEQAKLFCSDSGGSTVVFFTVLAEAGKFGCQAVVSQIYFLFVFLSFKKLISLFSVSYSVLTARQTATGNEYKSPETIRN